MQFNILVLVLFYDATILLLNSNFMKTYSHRRRISFAVSLVYGHRLPKPKPDPKPGFGGFPNPKPGFRKKAPGLESLLRGYDNTKLRIACVLCPFLFPTDRYFLLCPFARKYVVTEKKCMQFSTFHSLHHLHAGCSLYSVSVY